MKPALAVILFVTMLLSAARGEEPVDEAPVRAYYDKGLRYELTNGKLGLRLEVRGQLRYTYTDSEDDSDEGDLIADENKIEFTRARIKLGAYVLRPWLEFHWENDLIDGRLLTLRTDIRPRESIGVRAGQYKVLFSRERVESSGKQTFVDRSVVNRTFTVDRQRGGQFVGRLFAGRAIDSSYAIGAFVGAGRKNEADESDRPMVVGRWQWNYLGRELDYSSTDIGRRVEPAGSLTIGFVSYRSAFTRYSSDGGGQLAGFESGRSAQYETAQVMIESAYQYRGFAFNTEVHWKGIDDRVNHQYTNFWGYYFQVGAFFHEWFDIFPNPLELAARHANVQAESPGQDQIEYALGANWYFLGHRNKLQFDVTWLDYDQQHDDDSAWRTRLQWDLSF
jgi:phosphate-selective porin OprO/OprP